MSPEAQYLWTLEHCKLLMQTSSRFTRANYHCAINPRSCPLPHMEWIQFATPLDFVRMLKGSRPPLARNAISRWISGPYNHQTGIIGLPWWLQILQSCRGDALGTLSSLAGGGDLSGVCACTRGYARMLADSTVLTHSNAALNRVPKWESKFCQIAIAGIRK